MSEKTFQSIKEQVIQLTKEKEHVTPDKKFTSGGIYMLYVDNFDDEKVIPMYIGKTTNFKRRLREHIADVSAINDTSYADYHLAFLRGAVLNHCDYEGRYKACKIFKYMVEHRCVLQDIHMVVLEEIPQETLDQAEQSYFLKYLPAFFGFNQINSITEQWKYGENPEEYRGVAQFDADMFEKHMGYGFTEFNYLHAFRGSEHNQKKDLLDQKANRRKYIKNGDLEIGRQYTKLRTAYETAFEKAKPKMQEKFAMPVHEIFDACKFKSKGRAEQVITLLVNGPVEKEMFDLVDTAEYLEYYMNRDRRSRRCAEQLLNLFSERYAEIVEINAEVKVACKEYVNFLKQALKNSHLSLLFPNFVYEDYPLGNKQE